MPNEADYEGREQTLVKHLILQHYLERFAHIIFSRWSSITYVDCFAGPWNSRSDDLEDSSFAIALRELRKARETHASKRPNLRLRCLFLEKNREAYQRLEGFSSQVQDAEIKLLNGTFEDSVGEILKFVRAGGVGNFPFFFIDPTGWTGFALNTITPLLRLNPSEVLINFMTGHITRFLTGQETSNSFEQLFGSPDFQEKVAGLAGLEREDAAVMEYSESLKKLGEFPHVRRAIVLHRDSNRTNFHLVYATRHPKGVEVFKESEKLAMAEMERLRGRAQDRKRELRTGMKGLFAGQEIPDSAHYSGLRERYLDKAKSRVLHLLQEKGLLSYDKAWAAALLEPLVWESDLREWIQEWQKDFGLEVAGLKKKEVVPKQRAGHDLIWRGRTGL